MRNNDRWGFGFCLNMPHFQWIIEGWSPSFDGHDGHHFAVGSQRILDVGYGWSPCLSPCDILEAHLDVHRMK
jgi:hypothetical protein